jgi:hypothetical protein
MYAPIPRSVRVPRLASLRQAASVEASLGFRPRFFLILSTSATVPVLIAHALRQAVRHDDLGFCIDGGPRVLAWM